MSMNRPLDAWLAGNGAHGPLLSQLLDCTACLPATDVSCAVLCCYSACRYDGQVFVKPPEMLPRPHPPPPPAALH